MSGPIKLAHVWSSDMGVVLSIPHMRRFLSRGWRLFAICPEGPRLSEVVGAGVTWLPLPLSRRAFDPLGDARSAARIVRYCRSERFDFVHTHNIKAGLIGRVAAGLAGTPHILHTMHGMAFDRSTAGPKRLGHAALEWIACRFADRILVQSDEDRRTLLAHHLVAHSRLVKIGNGIPLARFDPAQVSGQPFRAEISLGPDEVLFVSAGRLVREKGFVELARGLARARALDPRIRLAIAGPRDVDKADCLSDAEMDEGRAAGVIYLGERPDMPAILAAADVVVLVSWREGMPRILMEGAAMGKPLLASDVRGCREAVTVPDGGALVRVRTPEEIAAAMVALAADPRWRRAAGDFNRRRALEEWDLDRVIDRIERVYEDLAEAA